MSAVTARCGMRARSSAGTSPYEKLASSLLVKPTLRFLNWDAWIVTTKIA
jgi:hypothetical protein